MDEQPEVRWLEGRYGLETAIGHGGMGVVWLAKDALLGRYVAVKELRLPPEMNDDERPALRARQLREARAAGRINHPAATTVHDVIEDDGEAFIVMELVRAPTLDELVRDDGPVDPAVAARIGLALLGALEAARDAGIVHRDVKPSNVLITADGDVKLTDFGIASLRGDPRLTLSGTVLGTPSYTAPEQAHDGDCGVETDVWGLGATLYFAVEGVAPFDRGGSMPTLAAVLEDDPRPTARAGPLEPVLAAVLVKEPARRPDLARVRAMLEPIAGGLEHAAAPGRTPGDDAESDDPSLRRAVGRAAKELAPAVSALLERHEARHPALRGMRRALGESDDHRSHAPPPDHPIHPAATERLESSTDAAPAAAGTERMSSRTGVDERLQNGLGALLRAAWRTTKVLLIALLVGTVALVGYVVLRLAT